MNVDDCKLLFLRYNREKDAMLKYSEFTDAFIPIDRIHARMLGTKKLQYSQLDGRLSFPQETWRAYLLVCDKMIRTERAVEGIRVKLGRRSEFHIEQAFNSCDNTYDGIVTHSDVSTWQLILFLAKKPTC